MEGHVGDDRARRGKPGNIGGVDGLRMFHTMTAAAERCGIVPGRPVVGLERHTNRAVPNRVREDLPAAPIEQLDHAREVRRRQHRPAGVRLVRVGRQHHGCVGFDDAVDHQLDGTDTNHGIGRITGPKRVELVGVGVGRGCIRLHRGIHAHLQIAGLASLLEQCDARRGRACLLDAGDAKAMSFLHASPDGAQPLLVGRLGQHLCDHLHGGFLQHARWFPGLRIPDHHTIRGIRGVFRDAGKRQRT